MFKKTQRLTAREGYDRWSRTYDRSPNPVVVMDSRHTFDSLAPQPGERILDAGCGTGRYLRRMVRIGCRPVGIDFSTGMLQVARRKLPGVPLAVADLSKSLPFRNRCFDAALCALVGEHLETPYGLFKEAFASLKPGGRLIFSVYHPEMAFAGKEANFERNGVEFRLGAHPHSVSDYLNMLDDAGFSAVSWREYSGDEALAQAIPSGAKYIGFPVLLILRAAKPRAA